MQALKKSTAIVLVIIYLLTYGMMRHTHMLVHQVGWNIQDDGSKTLHEHRISAGDFVGLLQPASALIASISSVIYYPLRLAESSIWYTIQPIETVLPP